MEEILKQVSAAVTDASVKVAVDIKPGNRAHAWLQKCKLMPCKRVFEVNGITYGNLVRISGHLKQMDKDLKSLVDDIYNTVSMYGPLISRIVAIGLYNKKTEPPESLQRFVEENMTANEMMHVMAVVIKQMNVTGFISTIILTKGLNILEMSQQLTGSQIAPGTLSQES